MILEDLENIYQLFPLVQCIFYSAITHLKYLFNSVICQYYGEKLNYLHLNAIINLVRMKSMYSFIITTTYLKENRMAGQIKKMIDNIIAKRANGNKTMENTTRTKLLLKGINPHAYDANSADDPEVIKKLQNLLIEFNIN